MTATTGAGGSPQLCWIFDALRHRRRHAALWSSTHCDTGGGTQSCGSSSTRHCFGTPSRDGGGNSIPPALPASRRRLQSRLPLAQRGSAVLWVFHACGHAFRHAFPARRRDTFRQAFFSARREFAVLRIFLAHGGSGCGSLQTDTDSFTRLPHGERMTPSARPFPARHGDDAFAYVLQRHSVRRSRTAAGRHSVKAFFERTAGVCNPEDLPGTTAAGSSLRSLPRTRWRAASRPTGFRSTARDSRRRRPARLRHLQGLRPSPPRHSVNVASAKPLPVYAS